MIVIKIADLPIGIENRYNHIELQARDYIVSDAPLFTVSVSEDDIDRERLNSATDRPRGYYESIVAYRKIAAKLPEYDAFLFHGSVIEYKDRAYIITANSGVGKTTHTRLWLQEFSGEVDIINGDKPIVRFMDGIPYASGTPWQGKENYGKNVMRPLCGIAFLSRGEKNRASGIEPSDAVIRFMKQIFIPKESAIATAKTMMLADRVIRGVKLVSLECNMEPQAAHVCKAALISDDA
jgi:hypothetical protein